MEFFVSKEFDKFIKEGFDIFSKIEEAIIKHQPSSKGKNDEPSIL